MLFSETSAYADYDAGINAFNVNGDKTTQDALGLHKITVEVRYDDPRGREQFFSNFFYLHITER